MDFSDAQNVKVLWIYTIPNKTIRSCKYHYNANVSKKSKCN